MTEQQSGKARVFTGKQAAGAGLAALICAFVGGYEGLRTKAYLDPVGIPTICYGFTHGVKLGQAKTPAECEGLLRQEVQAAIAGVQQCAKVPLSDGELGAYASFVYNAGGGAFCSSTLVRKLNAGDRRGACAQLSRWTYSRGEELPGLVRRRADERRMCESGLAGAAA